MSIMIVGGDSLGAINKELLSLGAEEILHVDGRKSGKNARLCIPERIALVLVFTDYVNHNTAKLVKRLSKLNGVSYLFAKRSWSSLEDHGVRRYFPAAAQR